MARYDEVRAAFWDDEDGDGGGDGGGTGAERPPLTDELVTEAERVLGVTLPTTLLDLLRLRDGGAVAPSWNAAPTGRPTSWSGTQVPFTDLMGVGRVPGSLSLLDTPYLVEEWELPSPIVLLTGDGHWWIGLDYRECGPRGEPSVTWFDAEAETELPLAADFRSFVETLIPSGA
ncbi:SMI1/KNR4 family protein [Streptomyces sp. NPDC006645]|uniref:SMI1/KNR4 family protein n=1 Tax=unclassified Streptomyces TaxID=2593676 RepID=UPI0033AFFDA1